MDHELRNTDKRYAKPLQNKKITEYIREAASIGWKMAIQRPAMEFRCEGVGKHWQEVLQEPFWSCDPYKEGATVKYYVHPSLHHGGSVLVKGKVFIN